MQRTPTRRQGNGSADAGTGAAADRAANAMGDLPHHQSDGYLVRDAHRAFQRLLERRIAPHGVTRGQWYFLRVLWTKDGLSQRELSERVGMMEPTTVIALRSMEKAGLIRRVRSTDDRRVTHVRLTAKAKRMRDGLLQLARSINAQADEGISAEDIAVFRRVITRMTANLDKVRQ
jgi:MarR family transcriptional regulator, organic hydroperoxide resistance regulator